MFLFIFFAHILQNYLEMEGKAEGFGLDLPQLYQPGTIQEDSNSS